MVRVIRLILTGLVVDVRALKTVVCWVLVLGCGILSMGYAQ